jgi:methylphosphotriester-DNA--protein-cysteine methyltransferase
MKRWVYGAAWVLVLAAVAAEVVLYVLPRHDARQGRQDAPQTGFVALSGSQVYHRPSCGYIGRAAPDRLRRFPTTAAAEDYGYRPCRACMR